MGRDSTGSMVSWRKSPWQDQTGTSHSNKAATPEMVAKEGQPSLSAETQLSRIESRLWPQEHANTLGARGHHCASANVWNRQTMRNWNKLHITVYWIKWFKMNQTASTQGNLTIPDFFFTWLGKQPPIPAYSRGAINGLLFCGIFVGWPLPKLQPPAAREGHDLNSMQGALQRTWAGQKCVRDGRSWKMKQWL